MKLLDMIDLNPRVCGGTPVIRGTRIPVTLVLDELASGASWASLRAGYPELCDDAIKAALLYAKLNIQQTELTAAEAV